MIYNFLKYIKEELKIDKLDYKTLDSIKRNLMFRLNEYRSYILSNIEYEVSTDKLIYKNFEKIDIPIIIRELKNEFSEDFIKELNTEDFLTNLNQILELRKRNTKKKIRQEFEKYYNYIEDIIKNNTPIIEDYKLKKINKNMNIKNFNSFNEKKSIKESDDVDNYMFFANLDNICRMVTEISEMDHSEIDRMLTKEHDWAADHISKSKESISHVYNWLKSIKSDNNPEIGME